jgi:uncharacterized cupin superfamily protein
MTDLPDTSGPAALTGASSSAGEWAPFTVNGRVIGEAQIVDSGESGTVAFWRVREPAEPFDINSSARTTVYVVEGTVGVTVAGQPTRSFSAGDVLVLAPGTASTWQVQARPYMELFVTG